MKRYKAAVIGLGNSGFLFGLDPKRKLTWNHVDAYQKCKRTELAGAVEISDERIKLFKQYYKNIPVFKTVRELMENIDVEIASIATPTESHYAVFKELLQYPVRGVFCEKPLASSLTEARELVRLSREKNIVFAVNHHRRWNDIYLSAKKMIEDAKIGRIKAATGFYTGEIFNVGAHLFDAILMLVQKKPELASGRSFNLESSDPDISGWIQFVGGTICTVVSTGKREDYVFELDIIGDEGRIRVFERNVDGVEIFSFTGSPRYSGYRELSLRKTGAITKKDRFVESIKDIISVIEGKKNKVNCSITDGLSSLSISFAMLESAKKKGKPVSLKKD